MRADHLGAAGGAAKTPNLDALARVGTVFTSAESPANESAFAHAALLTGRWPSAVMQANYLDFVVPRGAELLQGELAHAGYRTGAFVAGGHVGAGYGFDQGWSTWSSEPGFGSFTATVPRALDWLDEEGPPWFVWVHGYDAHLPYVTPGPWAPFVDAPGDAAAWASDPVAAERVVDGRYDRDRGVPKLHHVSGEQVVGLGVGGGGRAVTAEERAWLQARYDQALGLADAMVGKLLAAVAGRRDVLVIVVGDHGEDLLDHGFINHRHGLYESCIHFPLIVAGPGFEAAVVETPVSTRSVYTTALAAANLPRRPGSDAPPLQRVAAGLASEPVVFAEGVSGLLSARAGRWKLILGEVGLAPGAGDIADAPAALYDLLEDPAERTNVAGERPLEVEALRAAIVKWRGGLPSPAAAPAPIPPWVREELRQHGYW